MGFVSTYNWYNSGHNCSEYNYSSLRLQVLRHDAYRQVFALLLKETTLKYPDMGTRSEWKINSGWIDITIKYLGGGPSNNSRVIRVLSFQTDLHKVAEWRNMLPSWKKYMQQFMPLLSAPTQSWCTSRRKLVSCDRRWSTELVAKWTCFCKLEPPSVGQLFGYEPFLGEPKIVFCGASERMGWNLRAWDETSLVQYYGTHRIPTPIFCT